MVGARFDGTVINVGLLYNYTVIITVASSLKGLAAITRYTTFSIFKMQVYIAIGAIQAQQCKTEGNGTT